MAARDSAVSEDRADRREYTRSRRFRSSSNAEGATGEASEAASVAAEPPSFCLSLLRFSSTVSFFATVTNHLDLEAVLWLESYLVGYRHTLVVVSPIGVCRAL